MTFIGSIKKTFLKRAFNGVSAISISLENKKTNLTTNYDVFLLSERVKFVKDRKSGARFCLSQNRFSWSRLANKKNYLQY